jgi:nitrous oxidase accessory protein NosD
MGHASPFRRLSLSVASGFGTAAGRLRRSIPRALGLATATAMLASLVGVASVVAAGPMLFVTTSGNDGAACTQEAPCLTIGHAVSVAAPGSTIVVGAGTYHEQVFIMKRLTLVGHHATVDASGLLGGLGQVGPFDIVGMGVLIAGPGAAGSVFQGFTVENAPAEGILVAMTSKVAILHNELLHNDQAISEADPVPTECAAQGNVPGDCGEALHLLAVSYSRAVGNDVHDNVGGILLTDEAGPTHGNLIADNVSKDNKLDCGITLPSHNPDAVADPSKGGVYGNTILHNLSEGNGGAGVGMFAPFPGAASYDNRVIGNRLIGNGEAGVGIHSHAPGQNVSGNVIVGNWISGNGVDPDFVDMSTTIGIMVGTVADPTTVTIAANRIAHQDVGIYRSGPVTVRGLPSNKFASSVVVRVH